MLTHEHVAAEPGVVRSALEHTLACPVSLSIHALMGMFIAQVQSKHRCVLLNGVPRQDASGQSLCQHPSRDSSCAIALWSPP